jgi:hypothetical protein
MGVDCRIILPADVRVRDVAKVAGILAGLKASKLNLTGGSYGVQVEGAEAKTTCVVEMAEITLVGKLVDGERGHVGYYHYEMKEGRLLNPRSSAFWICVGRGLVDFFGGTVDYCDCDTVEVDYKARRKFKDNSPEDGQPWHDFQDAMLAVKPITKAQLNKAREWAAYK